MTRRLRALVVPTGDGDIEVAPDGVTVPAGIEVRFRGAVVGTTVGSVVTERGLELDVDVCDGFIFPAAGPGGDAHYLIP